MDGEKQNITALPRGDGETLHNEPARKVDITTKINQAHREIYIEALERYPTDESIDQAAEKKLIRKLDMRIIPLIGICYFFYVCDAYPKTPI